MGISAAQRSIAARATDAGRRPSPRGAAAYLASAPAAAILVAVLSAGLFYLVWIYATGLRDPRYLDGWVLAGGMILQLYFHIAAKTAHLSPKAIIRWRKFHILLGYLLIATFVSHCDFTMPDTGFEWALWSAFVLVTLSGIFGTYIAWVLEVRSSSDSRVGFEAIPARRVELAEAAQAVASAKTDAESLTIGLPAPPYDAWIMDLHSAQLRDFFQGQKNTTAHLLGSQRPLKRMTDEIDSLSRYVDRQGQDKLATIKSLVIEKDRLDFANVHLALTKGWLFVHVPATYALIVLTALHILVTYAFSSGAW